MALTLMLWLCCLPLIGLLIIPFFGLKMAAVVALILFLVMMAICWGICGWKVVTGRNISSDERR
jgi:hypothetical protein